MLLRFLRYTTGFSAICWDGTAQMLEELENKHCFSRQTQPLLTVKGLQTIFEQMKPGNLYEVEDLLGVHFFFFLFQDKTILVGPFVTTEWSDDGILEKKRLVDAGLPASYLLPYKLYYCSYCALNQSAAIRIVTGAVTSLLPDVPPYMYQRFSGTLGHTLPESYAEEEFDFDSAVHQFELEKQFYKLVSEGHTFSCLCTKNIFRTKSKRDGTNHPRHDSRIFRCSPIRPHQPLFSCRQKCNQLPRLAYQ